jgi:hypothetical protein
MVSSTRPFYSQTTKSASGLSLERLTTASQFTRESSLAPTLRPNAHEPLPVGSESVEVRHAARQGAATREIGRNRVKLGNPRKSLGTQVKSGEQIGQQYKIKRSPRAQSRASRIVYEVTMARYK